MSEPCVFGFAMSSPTPTSETHSSAQKTGALSKLTDVQLRLGGIACVACTDLIERDLQGAEGVVNPTANYTLRRAFLQIDPARTSVEQVIERIEKLGYHAVSLLGWQAGFNTTSAHTSARIRKVEPDRIKKELDKKNIVIVAGFQGISKYGDITTLGRGGSDTSAVAIAAAMHADLCQIFTDVEGVYTADPRKVKNAKKLQEISYDEMLELATLGAQVLNNRSVEMAKKYNIELEVLSSMTKASGTIVKEKTKMEKMLISGVAKDTDVARISVMGVPNIPGLAFKMFSKLSAKDINVDIILQSIGHDGKKDISFTVAKNRGEEAVALMKEYTENLGAEEILYDDKVAKISIVGAGMESHAGVATKMFEALYDAQVNIQMISTSEIKVSVLIDSADADKAVSAIHSKFFD